MIVKNVSSNFIRILSEEGEWEFGVEFRTGRGRSFNTYTKYYLIDPSGNEIWSGFPKDAPDPMNPSETRSVYDFFKENQRIRKWLEKKIPNAL
jgi:hypothetical protein